EIRCHRSARSIRPNSARAAASRKTDAFGLCLIASIDLASLADLLEPAIPSSQLTAFGSDIVQPVCVHNSNVNSNKATIEAVFRRVAELSIFSNASRTTAV